MIKSVVDFWKESYTSNPAASWLEMISTIATMIGSAILTFTVTDLNPAVFIPFYWIGSVTGMIAAYMRKLIWILILTGWFTALNSIMLVRLFITG